MDTRRRCGRHLRASLLVVVAALALAGCVDAPVGGFPAAPTGPVPQSAPPVAPAAVARADADFARMMIPHHEQALTLAALVRGRSTTTEIADLAFRIDREQVEEVGQLQGFLRLRDEPLEGAMAMSAMDGMATPETIARLRASRGAAFDRLWLSTMTAHHEGALVMSRQYLDASGGRGALAEFARTLIPSQQAEIDEMAQVAAP